MLHFRKVRSTGRRIMDAYLGLLFELLFSGAVLVFCVWQLWSLRRMDREERRQDSSGNSERDDA
jgi:hypothetical protein